MKGGGDHETWVAFMLRRVYNLGGKPCPKSWVSKIVWTGN